MRVALVLAGPYPALRGSQVLARQLATGLATRGHVVVPVTYGSRDVRRQGPSVERVACDAALTVRLWRTVRREAIDVMHAHNYEAAIAGLVVARLTGCPLVYHGHNAMGEELPAYFPAGWRRRLAGRIGVALDAQVPRRADHCIAVSDELGALLRSYGVADERLTSLHPASDPTEVGPTPVPRETSGVVCYAGNLDAYQNFDLLRRGFARVRARVPSARLLVLTHAGEAGRGARVLEGDGIDLVCAPSYGELRARLDDVDVVVSPRAERSGFPMKLLTYMAAGKAIVAAAGSAKGLVDRVTARIVPDDDEAAFADAIVELLEDPVARRRLGAAVRRVAEDGGAWAHALDRLESIYRTVVTEAARGGRMRTVTCPQ